MRTIPVDLSRLDLIATGKVSSKAEYVELSDGSRKASGNQAKDEATGQPLWVIDVLVDDDDARRAEVVGVTVPSADEPNPPKYRPVRFTGVTARIYVDRASGQARVSLVAESVETAASSKPQAAA
ncbi:hypothetical protein [Pseudonocardia acidicola]|uniref:Plasmid replication, integration and excision activator n=1 Tax=Pseudonocardia acidicola TaxID=2724939 RepID=A0ABX1SCU3_9PSEU|nr:hypothetical protein [Pseudonocardia acidicola]NMH98910.1 hypothetical protein [Pseudonocardia acidicola]